MKKFLSLVLAVIMTMSLVTISAGATEYRDLTDKDEIQYEEAVAVLNRIGVITGYDDGSFRPEGELTRGAAAKIIVSLLIGPDAASNLPNATAPYPDVPSSHTFAGVISYCKTAGIISGYGDGTFKPGNSLTGFAFAKMLLGALGYKSNIEGFVDTGWTMNVAKVGNAVGLFDRLSFDGSAAVNREEACQLALNTLKATMVTYGGTTVVSGTQTLAVGSTQAVYVTSNNRDINANINRRVINAVNNEMTLEFGEEHFKDLRLEHDKYDPAYDIYGHPSNEWSYKKVTIGTFPLEADFTFTKQMAHREETVAAKEKALGLRNYDTYSTDHRAQYTNWSTASSNTQYNSPFDDATQITINGYNARVRNDAYDQTTVPSGTLRGNLFSYDAGDVREANKEQAPSLSEICDLTDNGVTVEVYVCPVDADFITNVVVTRTQLMKVDHIGSDYVSLEDISPDSRDPRRAGDLEEITGYNAFAIDVNVQDVKDDNYDAYNVLSALKAGDRVAIVPYTADDGRTWEVGEAYVPETASGALSKVVLYANTNKTDGNAVGLVVGGTEYPINEWNKDMIDADGNQIKATRKDVTVYLAKDGTVLWANEIGNSDDWMVVGDYYQGTNTTTGKVAWFVHGWTIGGEEVDLDLGTIRGAAEKYAPGELVRYSIATTGSGEYELTKPSYDNQPWRYKNGNPAPTEEPLTKQSITGIRYKTGEGIYEISQYAETRGSGDQPYKISTGNSDLALERYSFDACDKTTGAVTFGGTYTYNATGPKWINKNRANSPEFTDGTGGQEAAHPFNYNYTSYDGVKFIFVSFDENGEVETIDVQSGVKNVSNADLCQFNRNWSNIGTGAGPGDLGNFVANAAEAYVDENGKVKAVVIKTDSAEANLNNIAVITDTRGTDQFNKGAETELDGYTRQYRVGPNFDEELTGTFDRAYSVGDVLTIRKDGDLIIGKYFHAKTYMNTNPDVLMATTIEAVKTLTGSTSKSAFRVTAFTASDGVTGLNKDNVAVMSSKNILGDDDDFVTDNDYKTTRDGLITVDSNTIFIDQRAGHRDDEIDSLDDLLDRDLTNVKVKVLLNGKSNTDSFRHAYVVVVMSAPEKTNNADAPAVGVSAALYTGIGSANNGKPVTVVSNSNKDGSRIDKAYEVTVAPDTAVDLTSTWTLSTNGKAEDMVWREWSKDGKTSSVLSAISSTADGSTVRVWAPATAGDYKIVSFSVTNRDTTVDGEKTTTTTKYIKIIADADGSSGGDISATGDITFDNGTASKNGAKIDSQAYTVNTSHQIVPDFTIVKPDWAKGSAAANSKFSAKVYRNGGTIANDTVTDQPFTTGAAGGATVSFTTAFTDANCGGGSAATNYKDSDNIKMEITDIKWDAVALQFVDENGDEIPNASTLFTVNTPASMTTAGDVDFTLNTTSDAGSVTFAYVSGNGLDESAGAINKAKTCAATGASINVTDLLGSVKAAGGGYVKIQVTGLGSLAEKIGVSSATPALLTATGVKFDAVTEKIALYLVNQDLTTPVAATSATAEIWAYAVGDSDDPITEGAAKVTVKGPDGIIGTNTITACGIDNAVKIGSVTLSKSWVIAGADVTVEAVSAPEVQKVTYTGATKTLTVIFDQAMTIDTGKTKEDIISYTEGAGGVIKPGSVNFDGTTWTAVLSDDPEGGTSKIVAQFVKNSSGLELSKTTGTSQADLTQDWLIS